MDGMVLQWYFELATKAHTIYDALHVVSLQPAHRIEVVLRLSADMDAWYVWKDDVVQKGRLLITRFFVTVDRFDGLPMSARVLASSAVAKPSVKQVS
jgi:hypothetical protein